MTPWASLRFLSSQPMIRPAPTITSTPTLTSVASFLLRLLVVACAFVLGFSLDAVKTETKGI